MSLKFGKKKCVTLFKKVHRHLEKFMNALVSVILPPWKKCPLLCGINQGIKKLQVYLVCFSCFILFTITNLYFGRLKRSPMPCFSAGKKQCLYKLLIKVFCILFFSQFCTFVFWQLEETPWWFDSLLVTAPSMEYVNFSTNSCCESFAFLMHTLDVFLFTILLFCSGFACLNFKKKI